MSTKEATTNEAVVYKSKSRLAVTWSMLKKNNAAIVGMSLFAILIFVAIFADLIKPYDHVAIDVMNANAPPSAAHLAGTDYVGRDIFSRLLVGTRYSLVLGFMSTILCNIVGIFLGSIAGYYGGAVDEVMMRLTDVFQSIPPMILNVAVACALGPGYWNTIFVMAIGGVAGAARMMRAQLLQIRTMEYAEAAAVVNCSTPRIILRHLLPNAFAPLLVGMTMGIGAAIMAASGLAYLGLGVQPPTPEWGAMLSDGRQYLAKYPWMCIFPGVLIMVTVLATNLFGDGLRDALDPKLKK